ncbi:hypothetical protein [Novosphingobium sp. 9]|uniref:hypothetical protein n=1 Tax=Novosphingobium sp. 9 TaxID=2025349 RepID=UPI0021B622CE|nr:hypothetical protein [Novosphingobium sp. 9]
MKFYCHKIRDIAIFLLTMYSDKKGATEYGAAAGRVYLEHQTITLGHTSLFTSFHSDFSGLQASAVPIPFA